MTDARIADAQADASETDSSPGEDATVVGAVADGVTLNLTLGLELDGVAKQHDLQVSADLVKPSEAEGKCGLPYALTTSPHTGAPPSIKLVMGLNPCDSELSLEGIAQPVVKPTLVIPMESFTGEIPLQVRHAVQGIFTNSGAYWGYGFVDSAVEITDWSMNGEQIVTSGRIDSELALNCQGTEAECARLGASARLSGTFRVGYTPN